MINRCKLEKALAITMFLTIILSCWLWWESYKCTVKWGLRDKLFPLPFYLVWVPHWFVVDFAILLIVFSAFILTLIIVMKNE